MAKYSTRHFEGVSGHFSSDLKPEDMGCLAILGWPEMARHCLGGSVSPHFVAPVRPVSSRCHWFTRRGAHVMCWCGLQRQLQVPLLRDPNQGVECAQPVHGRSAHGAEAAAHEPRQEVRGKVCFLGDQGFGRVRRISC